MNHCTICDRPTGHTLAACPTNPDMCTTCCPCPQHPYSTRDLAALTDTLREALYEHYLPTIAHNHGKNSPTYTQALDHCGDILRHWHAQADWNNPLPTRN